MRLERGGHRLQVLRARMDLAHASGMERRHRRLREARQALESRHPRHRLAEQARRADWLLRQLQACGDRGLQRRADRLDGLARALHSVSPLGTLSRGYAILRKADDGAVVRSIAQVSGGQPLRARVADGEFEVRVTGNDESI